MIKANSQVSRSATIPTDKDAEFRIYPQLHGLLVTLSYDDDRGIYECKIPGWGMTSARFASGFQEWLISTYGYRFHQITILLAHKIIPVSSSITYLADAVKNDVEIDFNCYNLAIYMVKGTGEIKNLEHLIVRSRRCFGQHEVDYWYGYHAEESRDVNKWKIPMRGIYIAHVDAESKYNWYRRDFHSATKLKILGVDPQHLCVFGLRGDGTQVVLREDRREGCRWLFPWIQKFGGHVVGKELQFAFRDMVRMRYFDATKQKGTVFELIRQSRPVSEGELDYAIRLCAEPTIERALETELLLYGDF